MANKIAVILSRHRTARANHERLENEIVRGLASRAHVDLTITAHLYDLPPDGPAFERMRSIADDMIVLAWLYPRSAYWVLDANRVRGRLGRTSSLPEEEPDQLPTRADAAELPDRRIWCLDLRTNDRAAPYLEEIARIADITTEAPAEATSPTGAAPDRIAETPRPRWYPVIDYGRCTNCLECLNFCLFGVFGLDESDVISIDEPDACRDGCPACSRICPAGAIMFPQHNDPAIAGDPKASREALKLDLSQLFGGADPTELAAAERDRALAEKEREERAPDQADRTADRDELDALVDELDDADL